MSLAQTVHVSTQDALQTALANAKGGDTILLEGGNYGDLQVGRSGQAPVDLDVPVTIASADPDNPAVFNGFDIRDSKGITFHNVTFDYTHSAGEGHNTIPFRVDDSHHITFDGCTFDGDQATGTGTGADGYPAGVGLMVSRSTHVEVTDSTIANFWKAMMVKESTDVTIADNDIHHFRSDGLALMEVGRVLIDGNHLHNRVGNLDHLDASGALYDHADMIQMFANNTETPFFDITIRGNVLDVGDGEHTHSIFITNTDFDRHGQDPAEMHRNIVIEDNLIKNAHMHGITVGATDGLTVRGNSLVHVEAANYWSGVGANTPTIKLNELSRNVTVDNNVGDRLEGYIGQADWQVGDNLLAQPAIEFAPQPAPAPTPTPNPAPSPAPAPAPTPTPNPGPTPDPTPDPTGGDGIHVDLSVDYDVEAPAQPLVGTDGADVLWADRADLSVVRAGGGDDVLRDTQGDDILWGEAGADKFVLDMRTDRGPSVDVLRDLNFGEGDRIQVFSGETNTFFGDDRDNNKLQVYGQGGTLFIDSIADFIELESLGQITVTAAPQGVTVAFTAFPDRVIELPTIPAWVPQPETVYGTDGDDVIWSAWHKPQRLRAGEGDDVLRETGGDDVMWGDSGADKFVLDLRHGSGPETDVLADLNFAEGDRVHVVAPKGTFLGELDNGNPLQMNASGTALFIDSVADLLELEALGLASLHTSSHGAGTQVRFTMAPDRAFDFATIALPTPDDWDFAA